MSGFWKCEKVTVAKRYFVILCKSQTRLFFLIIFVHAKKFVSSSVLLTPLCSTLLFVAFSRILVLVWALQHVSYIRKFKSTQNPVRAHSTLNPKRVWPMMSVPCRTVTVSRSPGCTHAAFRQTCPR